jgi:hypothetical protein
MEVQINVYPQQQNVEIVTEPNVTNINVTTYAVINPQFYDLSEFTNTEVDRFAKLSDIVSSIAGYATEAWVNSRGFITNVITALGFTPENVANKNTSTSLGTSDSLYPTQNAVKTYVDTGLSAKQNSLGFTPENADNKENIILDTSKDKYPTNRLVKEAVDAKQNSLGFTPENVTNKATTLASPNNTTYPTTQAVANAIPATITNINQIANRSYNDLQNLPSIPTAITNLNQIATRSYNDLQNLPTPNVFVDSTPSADVTATVETLVKTYSIGTLTGKKMIEFTALAHKIGSATADLRLQVYLHNTVTNTSVGIGQAVSLTTSQFLGKQNTIALDGNTMRQLLNSATAAPSVYNWYSVNITESTIVASDPHEIRVFIRNGASGSGIKLFMFKYEIQ